MTADAVESSRVACQTAPMETGYHEPCPRRVRAYRHGRCVLDTTAARYVWLRPHYPAWFVPESDVRLDLLPPDAPRQVDALPGYVHIPWAVAQHWFEEDDEVYVHPRDPYKRVDIRASSRHVRVSLDGVVLAESRRPVLLFETSLPTRYYLPMLDVRLELLTPSDTSTGCPYNGTAQYWTVTVNDHAHRDLVWSYRHPYPDLAGIAGRLCFYNERVDLDIDGERLARSEPIG